MRAIFNCLRAALIVALLCVSGVAEATVTDSISIYFRGGKSNFEPGFCDNGATLAPYLAKIRELNAAGCLEKVTVEGYVSPDGRQAFNERLARRRCATMASILRDSAGVSPKLIKTVPVGIDWAELRRMVKTRTDVPSRRAVLRILNSPIWQFNSEGEIIGGRKQQLMDLRGGRPYRWLLANIFPEMRKAVSISLSAKPLPVEPEPEAPEVEEVVKVEEVERVEEVEPIETTEAIEAIEAIPEALPDTAWVAEPHVPLHRFALKTNMLYDAILLPNLELEWYIDNRWSVTLEGNLAWWGSYAKNKSYRLLMLSPEVRYWFLRGPMRRGLFVGATAGGGLYDFLKDTTGHYGEGAIAGLTCGYQWPITRTLSLEAEVGAGYAYINDKEYMPYEGHHVFQRRKAINYFGPIKAEFSLVWRFFDTLKPKAK